MKEGLGAKKRGKEGEKKKEKKRADAYKSKALEAHNRAKYSGA